MSNEFPDSAGIYFLEIEYNKPENVTLNGKRVVGTSINNEKYYTVVVSGYVPFLKVELCWDNHLKCVVNYSDITRGILKVKWIKYQSPKVVQEI